MVTVTVNRRSGGFTLLELLIALALIGLMVTLLFAALRFSGRAWEAVDQSSERNTSVQLVWQYLSDRLGQARFLSGYSESTGDQHFFFSGSRGALEFVSPMPAHLGSGGLYIIRLHTQHSGGKESFQLTRWLYHPEVLDGSGRLPRWEPLLGSSGYSAGKQEEDLRAYYSETSLLDDIETVEFSYFGSEDGKDEQPSWQTSWEDKKFLPLLVKIEIEDQHGRWPEMVFELPSI